MAKKATKKVNKEEKAVATPKIPVYMRKIHPILNRYEFILLFDVRNGNPNGDPDAGGMPRVNPITMTGLVSHGCQKRKVRNYVALVYPGRKGFEIYIKYDKCLNNKDAEAGDACGVGDQIRKIQQESNEAPKKIGTEMKKNDPFIDRRIVDYLCDTYFDIRTFGGVITTLKKGNLNNGQIIGPVQFCPAESVDPIDPQEITITRCAITKESDAEKKDTEFGSQWIVPYGLYRAHGYVSACLAEKTGFSEDDLTVLWESIMNMFEHDHAAMRGEMAVRKLIIFKHESKYGNAPAHKLFDAVKVEKKEGVEIPQSFDDYTVSIGDIPEKVQCIEMD